MNKLSTHFSRHEFECSCGCGFNTVDTELLTILEQIRDHFDQRIFITSAARCLEYNRSIGSSDGSQHVLGKAADIYINTIPLQGVNNFINRLHQNRFGIGIYNDFLHIDVRDTKARWDKRS